MGRHYRPDDATAADPAAEDAIAVTIATGSTVLHQFDGLYMLSGAPIRTTPPGAHRMDAETTWVISGGPLPGGQGTSRPAGEATGG